MNEQKYLNDKIYTGLVLDWGLPDGSVFTNVNNVRWELKNYHLFNVDFKTIDNAFSTVCGNYRLVSIPEGYYLNEDGSASKIEEKHYWDGKEKLQVGMICASSNKSGEFECLRTRINNDNVEVALLMCLETFKALWFYKKNIKPIDTRSEKQKAIDKYVKKFGEMVNSPSSISILPNDFYDELVGEE